MGSTRGRPGVYEYMASGALATARTGRLMALLAVVAAATLALLPAEAMACGGCFSPPAPGGINSPQTVVQDAERIFFHHDPKTKRSIAWVEVRYSGLAKDFGWVLPLPKQPTVTVGTTWLFDRFDSRMAPVFKGINQGSENCRDPSDGCEILPPEDVGTVADAGGWASEDATSPGPGGTPPGVTVLDHGQTGPYDYIVVKGNAAKPLQDWLNKQGYATPKTATAIIESHIEKGDVFVAIKLSNGEGVNQIKPIVLEMHDADPCVPLRLTSIAASEDMTVVVTIAGPGRAIPKNFMHVRINPLRLNLFDGGKNYPQVLSAAIDEAAGHAFVTEYARPSGTFWSKSIWDTGQLTKSDNLVELAGFVASKGNDWLSDDIAQLFEKHLGLTKLLAVMKPATPLEALGYLWSCGTFWQNMGGFQSCVPQGAPGGLTLDEAKKVAVETGALVGALKEGIIDPIYDVGDMINGSKTVTRMVLRISPEEMDRDPIFAFNPALAEVNNMVYVRHRRVCSDGWLPAEHTRIAVDGLAGSWVVKGSWPGGGHNALDPRFKDAPLALSIELLDENGNPVAIDPSEVGLVDTAILGATPGTATLPSGFSLKKPKLWAPPPEDPPVKKLGPWMSPGPWCVPLPGWVDGKLPPTGEVPGTEDAGPMQPDGTAGPDSGAVDAGGHGPDGTQTTGGGGGGSTGGGDGGCSASGSAPSLPLAMGIGLSLLVLLRRRRSAAS